MQLCSEKHECKCSLSNLQCDSHTGGRMQMPAVTCLLLTPDISCLPGGWGAEDGGRTEGEQEACPRRSRGGMAIHGPAGPGVTRGPHPPHTAGPTPRRPRLATAPGTVSRAPAALPLQPRAVSKPRRPRCLCEEMSASQEASIPDSGVTTAPTDRIPVIFANR